MPASDNHRLECPHTNSKFSAACDSQETGGLQSFFEEKDENRNKRQVIFKCGDGKLYTLVKCMGGFWGA
ncbi:hypothetical protein DSCOOX_56370 [Desulfosarcina ovata subsp. ovata]|uniref:Uncharacterized protein n=1 Tax=Desulfosarcina ovata subsp. ovata TaxID=2752305 RepID=A0A5K8AIG8_9BACT|nr:hypothetical protein DSCOOX_56370 [Desulfosarcina ovata subsp. ovata]